MERIRAWVRMFFGFSRTETNAFIILLPLMIVILFSEPVYRWWTSRIPADFSSDQHSLDSLISQLRWRETDSINRKPKSSPVIHFLPFDPNLFTEGEFLKLGLSKFLSRRLVHFREKGGRFYRKEDLLKIYGMDSSWYDLAKPWIVIAPKTSDPKEKWIVKKKAPEEMIDINLADSLQLLKVYGVGPALSKRIRAFRSRLGGFVTMEQLQDVYGLDTAVVNLMKKKFFVDPHFLPRSIHLNTDNLEILLNHPYIRKKEGQAILSYRLQHGAYSSIDDLHRIQILTPDWINKIRPYLTLE